MARAPWLLVALAACGRIDFGGGAVSVGDALTFGDAARDAVGLQPIHQYRLNGNYADDYGGPDLVGHGGMLGSDGYEFGANQGLSVDNALPAEVYTLDIEFQFTDLSSWRKILDFDGLTQDSGFYTYESALQYVIVPGSDFLTGSATLTTDTLYRVTLTRDAANNVVGYIAGAPVPAARDTGPAPPTNPTTAFTFDDSAGVAALTGATATFFIDDTVTSSGEASAGVVRRIRIYDLALSASQVAATP